MSVIKELSRVIFVLAEAARRSASDYVLLGQARTMAAKAITMENINPNIVKLQYAVRGPLVIRAGEIEKEIQKGAKKPFKKVIRANIGDAHAMGQKPITFIRQVLSCVSYPTIMSKSDFPPDVLERAKHILSGCGGGSVGSYSASYGIESIRRGVAEYIKDRDGHPSNWENVCITAGASAAIKYVLQLFCNKVGGKNTGIMIPIPQYPLYSAALAEFGLAPVGYYLNEESGWSLDESELTRSITEAKDVNVRALVIINPGNPTGQVLSRENIEMVAHFANKHKLFIFADEVYQHNIYDSSCKFFSFKKVLTEMGSPYNTMELASFMTVSKGYMGECGLRGGWMELMNMDPEVQANLYKGISANLCPTVLGQTVVDCVARPPQKGEPSYDLWFEEKRGVLEALKERAKMLQESLNAMPGFKCNVVQGAMYAFPQIILPPRAVEAAKKDGKPADVFYAWQLLEETGICIIPGSGFGQKAGTYHFRTTILPQTPLLKEMLEIFKNFQAKFTQQYK